MNFLNLVVLAPLALSIFCFIFKRQAKWIALLSSIFMVISAGRLFVSEEIASPVIYLANNPFSNAVFLMGAIIALFIMIYSIKYMEGHKREGEYYAYSLIALACAAGSFFSTDFLFFLMFWGALSIPLYMLIGIDNRGDLQSAKKALIIVGGTDALMLIGIGILWIGTGTMQILPHHIPLTTLPAIIAFVCLLLGAFAKAGVMPLHSWIADSSEVAPAPVMAFLPASLDKLLGIYLLSRLCFEIFSVTPNSLFSTILMAAGAITIIGAVVASLLQQNLMKILSFCAVSQVGYMVLGLGTGIPLGIAGGLFHMFNHAIYKSCLFLSAGAVEKQTNTTELKKLGGLGALMPMTFLAFLIAALSISGIPPFNGFASKWMIYSAIIEQNSNPLWIVWLVVAMFGSAFTLASFFRVIYAVFLGQGDEYNGKIKEVSPLMYIPMLGLAVICVVFGIFAFSVPLKYLVIPIIGDFQYLGIWRPSISLLFMILGLLLGVIIYISGNVMKTKTRPAFYGGEELPKEKIKVTGDDFFDTVKRFWPIELINEAGKKRYFDIYEISVGLVGVLNNIFNWTYGVLPKEFISRAIQNRLFVPMIIIVLIIVELSAEIMLFNFGVRELLTGLVAIPIVYVGYSLAQRLKRSYQDGQ